MLRQSRNSNDTELHFAALGAAINLLVTTLMIVLLWQLIVLLMQACQLIVIFPWALAEIG